MEGLSTREIENKVGLWSSSTGEIFMNDVRVPPENLVGEENNGFKVAASAAVLGQFQGGARVSHVAVAPGDSIIETPGDGSVETVATALFQRPGASASGASKNDTALNDVLTNDDHRPKTAGE